MKQNVFSIKNDGTIFLDDTKLVNVKKFKLVSSAQNHTELTVTMNVRIGQVASEQEQ